MPLIKCRDGVYRDPAAALDAITPIFVTYEDEEIPTPDTLDTPPVAEDGGDDVRW
jgi:hypothetical protein